MDSTDSGWDDEVGALAAEWQSLTGRLADKLGEIESTNQWHASGLLTFCQWASIQLGLVPSQTRRLARGGQDVRKLGAIAAAVSAGRLSFDKASLIAAIATAETEAMWLNVALSASATQLSRITAAWRRVNRDTREDERDRDMRRDLTIRPLPNGLSRIVADLHPEDAAIVMAAVNAQQEATWRDTPAEDRQREAFGARLADALVDVAQIALDAGPDADGEATEHVEVIVHVDEAVLARRTESGRCHLAGGPSIPVTTAERLMCMGRIAALVEDSNGVPLRFGRSRRLATRKQKQVLFGKSGGCQFPGCAAKKFLEAHHAIHWPDGGKTDIDQLVLLCRRHHRFHHNGAYRIDIECDRLRFTTADGHRLEPPNNPEFLIRRPSPVPDWRPDGCRATEGGAPIPDFAWAVNVIIDNTM